MRNRFEIKLGLAAALLIPLVLGACGSGPNQPVAANGRLLRATDLPDMRLHQPDMLIPTAEVFAQALGDGNAVLFKEPDKAVPMLQRNGYVRAVAEDWTGPGTFAGAIAVEFATPEKASTALAAMYDDALQPCPNDPVCSIQRTFTVPGIPNSKGQQVTPYRKFGRSFTQYRCLFQVGSIVYGIAVGGLPESFDPGAVSKADSFAAFRALYARVKSGPSSGLFAPTPIPS